jgi:hypothetical protein
MLHKQSLALGPDQAGDRPSSPPQVKVQVTTEAHIEPLRASPMPKIPELALGSDEAGDPPSSPPQVKVQVATRTHIEPLRASPMNKMPEPTNASIITIEHKQSLASAHEAANRPSVSNQIEGLDIVCDAKGHIQSLPGLPNNRGA